MTWRSGVGKWVELGGRDEMEWGGWDEVEWGGWSGREK